MKKINKILLAILGACNKVMSLFIPIAVALLFINQTNIDGIKEASLMAVALAATAFRAIQVWID